MSLEGIERGLQATTKVLLDIERAISTISERLESIETALPGDVYTDNIESALESIGTALREIAQKP